MPNHLKAIPDFVAECSGNIEFPDLAFDVQRYGARLRTQPRQHFPANCRATYTGLQGPATSASLIEYFFYACVFLLYSPLSRKTYRCAQFCTARQRTSLLISDQTACWLDIISVLAKTFKFGTIITVKRRYPTLANSSSLSHWS